MELEYEDQHIHVPEGSVSKILCPLCGVQIEANPANMCVDCLKNEVDITEGISKQLILFWCQGCGRYQKPPWIDAKLESHELLSLCLKKIRGMGKDLKVVDADFIYTEPHSRRLKVTVTVQKEMFVGAVLQQSFVVEYVVQNLQCTDCQRSYTDHVWTAVVQVRQKVRHKRTFLWLEQLLIKHSVCAKAIGIKEISGGLDFYWSTTSQAQSMIHFLRGVVPIRTTESRKLISEDLTSNTKKFKYTYYAEIAPISRTDLVVLPKKLARSLGGVSQLMLCTKVTSSLHLVDVTTLRGVELNGLQFFRDSFAAVMQHDQLVEFDVLDVEHEDANRALSGRADEQSAGFGVMQLCEVHVARISDYKEYHIVSHLGNLIKPGDTVLGYVLEGIGESAHATEEETRNWPDVILVKKSYPTRNNRRRHREWKLKHLNVEAASEQKARKHEVARKEADLEHFMRDLEEDPELRGKVNLYKDKMAKERKRQQQQQVNDDMDDVQSDDGFDEVGVQLTELLEDMGNMAVSAPAVENPFDPPEGEQQEDVMMERINTRAPQRGQ